MRDPDSSKRSIPVDGERAGLALVLGHGHQELIDEVERRLELVESQILEELGIPVPSLKVRVDTELPAEHFEVRQESRVLGRQRIRRKGFLVIGSPEVLKGLSGEPITDPIYGHESLWVDELSEMNAYQDCLILDRSSLLCAYLIEVIRVEAHRLMDDAQVVALLSEFSDSGLVVEAKRRLTTHEIGEVLRGLLFERVSIKSLGSILSSLVACEADTTESRMETVRYGLREEILDWNEANDGRIYAAILAPELEARLCREWSDEGLFKKLEPVRLSLLAKGHTPIFIVPAALRAQIRRLVPMPTTVLTFEEVEKDAKAMEIRSRFGQILEVVFTRRGPKDDC